MRAKCNFDGSGSLVFNIIVGENRLSFLIERLSRLGMMCFCLGILLEALKTRVEGLWPVIAKVNMFLIDRLLYNLNVLLFPS